VCRTTRIVKLNGFGFACSARIQVQAPLDREDQTDIDWELLKDTFFFQRGKTYGWLAP